MGGSHKRKLRAEKAKIQLKGVKLAKGLNVTKAEFKVRKITIRSQLKQIQYVDGQRQVNLKEVLSKLKHHSANFRIESLRSLRDAISINHPGLLASLSNIIQGVVAVSLDLEKDTRRECFKTLDSLLGKLSLEAISPFFHIMSSYLRCAMTHIQSSIQEDALVMLDILLQHVPYLVAAESDKIFKNFMEMISKVRAEGDKAGRMLTVNMGRNQTTIQWRSKVLFRLQQMLKIVADHKRNERDVALKTNDVNNIYFTFSTKTAQHYGVKRAYPPNQMCDLFSIFNNSLSNTILTDQNCSSKDSEQLRLYVQNLMPLLLESWLEVRPKQEMGSRNMETLLTIDAAMILKIVLEILTNLWSLIEICEQQVDNKDLSKWVKGQYAEIFSANFLRDSYPYQQMMVFEENDGIVKRKNEKASSEMSLHCYQQNIIIAFLMCRFNDNALELQTGRFIAVLVYITNIVNCLSSKNSNDYLKSLVLALRALLLENGLLLLQLHRDTTKNLLKICIKSFLCNKFSGSGINSKILILLCEVVQDTALYNTYGGEEFSDFLEFLPNVLLKPTITESCLMAMGSLGKNQNMTFLNSLRKMMPKIVDHLQTIQVIGAINVLEGKKHVMNLFYWIKPQRTVDKEELQKLLNDVTCKITDKRIADYCKYILINP